MITVCIAGVLASVASSGFQAYLLRAKAAEGLQGLTSLATATKAYFYNANANKGIDGESRDGCFPSALTSIECVCWNNGPLSGEKQIFDCDPAETVRALGFDYKNRPMYHQMGARQNPALGGNVGGLCNVPPGEPNAFRVWAASDLNGNGSRGTLMFYFGVNENRQVYRHPLWVVPTGFEGVTGHIYEYEGP